MQLTMAARIAAYSFCIGACILLTGCPQKTAVWLAPKSAANALTLRFGEERGKLQSVAVGSVQVYRCADQQSATSAEKMWAVRAIDTAKSIDHVEYGIAPVGYHVDEGPRRLEPGCYVVQISGTGRTRFRINPDNTATDDGPPW